MRRFIFDRPPPPLVPLGDFSIAGRLGCVPLIPRDTYLCATTGKHPYFTLTVVPDRLDQFLDYHYPSPSARISVPERWWWAA